MADESRIQVKDGILSGVIGNPIPTIVIVAAVGIACRILIKSKALKALEDYAKGTTSKVDDIVVSLLINLIKEGARL